MARPAVWSQRSMRKIPAQNNHQHKREGGEVGRMGMHLQFFQIGKVLEYIGRQLRDVVHAEVTVETKNQLVSRHLALMTVFHW